MAQKKTLRASCRPSNTAFLNGSVSFFKSALARLRADIKSSRIVGSRPFRFLVVANRSVEVGKQSILQDRKGPTIVGSLDIIDVLDQA